MRKIVIFLIAVLSAYFQRAQAQDSLIQSVGYGRSYDEVLRYTWNPKDSLIYVGTYPNSHLNVYKPQPLDTMIFLGHTWPAGNETGIWTLSCDTGGIVYGGTVQTPPAYVFSYNPATNYLYKIPLSGADNVWGCVSTNNYVYFGTESPGSGPDDMCKLFKCNKQTLEGYNVFDSLGYQYRPFSDSFMITSPSCSTFYHYLKGHVSDYDCEKKIRCLAVGPGGKIYGVTGYGFVFAYDPVANTFDCFNAFEKANPDDTTKWITCGISNIEADNGRVFASADASPYLGAFEINYSDSNRVRQLKYTDDSPIFGTSLIIIGDNLYIANSKQHGSIWYGFIGYGLDDSVAWEIPWQDHDSDIHYARWGTNYLAGFSRGLDSSEIFSTYSVTTGISHCDTFTLPGYQSGDIISKFRSLAANDSNVYGGLYMGGEIERHRMSDDDSASSVDVLGLCGGANADAMLASDAYLYYGFYTQLGLGIYNPALPWHPNYADTGATPYSDYNPLLRLLKNAPGDTITDNRLLRVNCIAQGPIIDGSQKLYIGTGPSYWDNYGDYAWLIGLNTGSGEIEHIHKLDPGFCEGEGVIWTEDVDYYDGYSFIVGSNLSQSMVLITYMNPLEMVCNDTLGAGRQADQCVLVDSVNDRIYLGSGDSLGIYSLSVVLSTGGQTSLTGFSYVSRDTQFTLGAPIYDLVKGNDGNIYVGYGQHVGLVCNRRSKSVPGGGLILYHPGFKNIPKGIGGQLEFRLFL